MPWQASLIGPVRVALEGPAASATEGLESLRPDIKGFQGVKETGGGA